MFMRKYETLVLLSPELAEENRQEILDNLSKTLDKASGKLLTVDQWGMRELAYPVRKQTRGFYVRFEYLAPGAAVAELERIIRITDGVWKFVTVQLDDDAEVVVAAEEVA
jgi:small subunit ribosomal protein S6